MEYKYANFDVRFFAGIEFEDGIEPSSPYDLVSFYDSFFDEFNSTIKGKFEPENIIGMVCYPPDIEEETKYDYYALAEIVALIPQQPHIVTKKLPAGKYICFSVKVSKLHDARTQIYKYCKQQNISLHYGFDYEEYQNQDDYKNPLADVNICLKVEE